MSRDDETRPHGLPAAAAHLTLDTSPDGGRARPVNGHELATVQVVAPEAGAPAPPDRGSPATGLDGDDPSQLPDSGQPSNPFDVLVSLHYLRAAVRRTWLRIAACTFAGLLLGGGFLLSSPNPHVASTSLVLRHPAGSDPWRAMLTDVSFTGTRVIADQTVHALGLPLTPEQLRATLVVPAPTSEVLTVTMSGPSDAEAVRRLAKFTDLYLAFRARTLSTQANVLIEGYRQQAKALQVIRGQVQAKIDALGTPGATVAPGQDSFNDLITRRAQIDGQVSALQTQAQDAELQRDAVIRASMIVDPAATVPSNPKMQLILALFSGLVGGLAIGVGLTVAQTLLSDKLRMREEFAAALDSPVRCSVRSVLPPRGIRRWLGFLPWLRRSQAARRKDLTNLAWTIERTLERTTPSPTGPRRLAVACVDSADEARAAVAATALELGAGKHAVQLVDLSEAGLLERAVARTAPAGTDHPPVLRPAALPARATPPAELEAAAADDAQGGLDPDAVRIVLADVSLDIGLEYLKAWSDDVVVAVTAGRSGSQRVRTTRYLLESAGLDLRGVILFRRDRLDTSGGT